MHSRAQRLHYNASRTVNHGNQIFYSDAYSRWRLSHNLRPFQTISAGAVKDAHSRNLPGNGLEPRAALKKQRIKFQRGEDKDIIVDDLAATLLAHKAKNRASLVRRINVDLDYVPTDFRRPSIVEQLYLNRTRARQNEKESHSDSEARKAPKIQRTLGNHGLKVLQKTQTQATTRASKKGTESRTIRPLVSEYEGKDILPCLPWKRRLSCKGEESPWLALVINTEGDGLTQLRNEIYAYEDYMSLKPHDILACRNLAIEIRSMAKEAVRCPSSIEVIGSHSTNLATPTSDLDFRLSIFEFEKEPLSRGPSATRPKALKAGQRALWNMEPALQKSPSFRNVELVGASISVLRAIHCPTGLEVQIQANHTHPASIPYSITYLSEFPTLRPLYILLRSALHIRGLNNVFNGGLGSYPLLIMIVYALKRCSTSFPRSDDIASQLLYILRFYSEADLYTDGFSLDPVPTVFDKYKLGIRGIDALPKLNPSRQPYLLCLQDPANPKNDLGRKCTSIKHIQVVFQTAERQIRFAMKKWEIMDKCKRESAMMAATGGCLWPLVGADYRFFEKNRIKLEQSVQKAVLAKYDQH